MEYQSCPYCDKDLSKEIEGHYESSDYPEDFEIECPYCKKYFDVVMEICKDFWTYKKEDQ